MPDSAVVLDGHGQGAHPCPKGYEDGYEWIDSDGYPTTLEDAAEDHFFGNGFIPDEDSGFALGTGGEVVVNDASKAEDYAQTFLGLRMRGYQWSVFTRGIFLTREEAEEHLRLNHYHYSPWAHPFYDHAFRAPDVEMLWRLLLSVDASSLRLRQDGPLVEAEYD